MRIAVISDTHNQLRPEVLDLLCGCSHILHAGDICRTAILDRLREIAPVAAVRGNNDWDWAEPLPVLREFELAGLRICMAHMKRDLPVFQESFDLIVTGHTHRYSEEWRARSGGRRTLVLNPGSCGPARFLSPVTLAMLTVDRNGLSAERIDVLPGAGRNVQSPGSGDLRKQIETVIRETGKGRSPAEIAKRAGMDPALAEQIARLYVTHPGVTADGIMPKLGL